MSTIYTVLKKNIYIYFNYIWFVCEETERSIWYTMYTIQCTDILQYISKIELNEYKFRKKKKNLIMILIFHSTGPRN